MNTVDRRKTRLISVRELVILLVISIISLFQTARADEVRKKNPHSHMREQNKCISCHVSKPTDPPLINIKDKETNFQQLLKAQKQRPKKGQLQFVPLIENGKSEIEKSKSNRRLKEPVTEICSKCHQRDIMSHPIDVLPRKAKLPADLPIYRKKLTCISCHQPHGPWRSKRPWRSTSFFKRFFMPKKYYRTFFLRRNNVDGELCRSCHQWE